MTHPAIGLELLGIHPGKSGGMETYAFELTRALVAGFPATRFVVGVRPDAVPLLEDMTAAPNCEVAAFPPSAVLGRVPLGTSVSEWVGFHQYLVRRGVRLTHATFAAVRPPWWTRPFVVTLPDTHFRTLGPVLGRLWLHGYSTHVRTTVRRARRVLTFSEYARRTIVEEYGIDPERVAVTYLGVDHEAFTPISEGDRAALRAARPGWPDRFLLYPAALFPHKNHRTLFLALRVLKERHRLTPALILTGTGTTAAKDAVLGDIAANGLSDQVRWVGVVPRHDLLAYFRLARLMVFPSLMEGFGLPVLEAMACGCPVACSATTATGEVAGDAALRFDPNDPDGLAEAIRRGMDDTALRTRLVAAGFLRSAEFTWTRTARDTAAVYSSLTPDAPRSS